MDALISQLNQRISTEVANKQPANVDLQPGKQSFAEILDNKSSTKMLDKITDQMKQGQSEIKVIAADNIQVNSANLEIEKSSNFSIKEKMMDMFSGLNDDMNSLESTIEVLSAPDTKLTRAEMLACQAGISQFSLTAEMTSKGFQAAVSSVQTILNTNIG
jgi:hypothetical protein